MKNLMIAVIFTTILNSILLSCSSQKVNKEDNIEYGKEPASIDTAALKEVQTKLDVMVEAAKKSGQSSVNYLASDFFLKASAAQAEGDYMTANLLYEYLLKLADDNYVKTKYSVSLIRAGELDKSEKYLAEVYKASKYKDAKIGLVLAGVYTGLNKINEAREIYTKILSHDKKNEDACVFLSKSYILEDKTSKAKEVLENCEKADKNNGAYAYYVGKLYVDKGKIADAKKYFERSLKKQPDFSRSILALGLIHEEKDQHTKALETYKSYLKKEPSDKLILSRVVQLMFQHSMFKEIIPYAERLSDLEPDDLNLKVKLGILYSDAKDFNKAISVFSDLLKAAPTSDKILYYLGSIFNEVKNYEKSIEHFMQVEESSALFQDSSLQVASMLSKMASMNQYSDEEKKDYSVKFEKFVDEKMKKMPDMVVEFSIVKASYFEAKNMISKAIDVLDEVKSHEKFKKDHRYYMANLFEKNKEFDQAYEIVEKMIQDNPNDAYAWNFIGYSYADRGIEMDKALKYISKANELKPKDGYIMDSLAWYYYKLNNFEKAIEVMAKAVALVPNDVTITKHYAIILREAKKFDEARKHLVKALSFAQTDHEIKDLYQELKDLDQIRIPANKIDIIQK